MFDAPVGIDPLSLEKRYCSTSQSCNIAVEDLPKRRRAGRGATAGDLAGSYCGPDQGERHLRILQLTHMYASIAAAVRRRVDRTGEPRVVAFRRVLLKRRRAGLPCGVKDFARPDGRRRADQVIQAGITPAVLDDATPIDLSE